MSLYIIDLLSVLLPTKWGVLNTISLCELTHHSQISHTLYSDLTSLYVN